MGDTVDATAYLVVEGLRVPTAAFDALRPEAIIVIPQELVQLPVQAEAIQP
jgi:hypothetical protein